MRIALLSLTLFALACPLGAAEGPAVAAAPVAIPPAAAPAAGGIMPAAAEDEKAQDGDQDDQDDGDQDEAPPEPSYRIIPLLGPCDEQALRTVLAAVQETERTPAITDLWLVIDSVGGNAAATCAITNAFTLTTAKVHTVNCGHCAGEAVAVFAAATGRRYAFPDALFVIGRPAVPVLAPGIDEALARILGSHDDRATERLLKNRSQLPMEWFPLAAGTWHPLTAEAALAAKLTDAVVERLPLGEDAAF